MSASAAAITYAADNDYHVINMSYGSDGVDENGDPLEIPDQPNVETDAIRYAWSRGVVLVPAAGNGANDTEVYPAANPEVIAVAATNDYDDKASFSTFGNGWVSMMAPGEDILSTSVVASCVFYADILGYSIRSPERGLPQVEFGYLHGKPACGRCRGADLVAFVSRTGALVMCQPERRCMQQRGA